MQRDTKQKWAAFAALLLVSVGTAWGSCALKNHLAAALPPPVVPYPVPYNAPSTPAPEVDLSTEGEDAPTPPSSIEESVTARPPSYWAGIAGAYAPDHSDARTVFNRGTAIDVPLSRRLVACNVAAFAAATTAGGQLEIRVRVGASPERMATGRNGVVWTVMPLVSLSEGESIRIAAGVRRGETFTEIGQASAKLTGGPLAFRHPKLSMDCRVVSPHDVDELFAENAARADAVIRSHASQEEMQRATSDLAALVGWADPRVTRRVRAIDAASDGGPR